MDKKSVLNFLGLAFSFLTCGALVLGAYIGLTWYRDPLHLFQKAEQPAYLIGNMRIQAAGIINSFDFDSIILGTSLLENSSSREMSKALGGNFVNISVSGGSHYERAIILKYALRRKNIIYVVYSIENFYSLNGSLASYNENNWAYLYDDIWWNDFKAYLDPSQMKNIFKNIKQGTKTTLDRPNAWFNDKDNACRFGGIDNWIRHKDKQGMEKFLTETVPNATLKARQSPTAMEYDELLEQKVCDYVEKYILSIAEKNPETIFYYVFPPKWRFYYAGLRQTESKKFAAHQKAIRYIVNRSEELNNVQVFGFEDCDFVDDISNYKDTWHFSADINEYISASIVDKRHQLTSNNIDAYLKLCDKKAKDFDLQKLAETIASKLNHVQ